MQQGRPLSFMSQALKGKNLQLPTYEKELMAVVLAVKKWRPYLLGQSFKVQTDQQSLKYLPKQKIGTPQQQKWITKLLGYDMKVEYKPGRENRVADALSRKEKAPKEATLFAVTSPRFTWLKDLRGSYTTDTHMQAKIQKFHAGKLNFSKYSMLMDYCYTGVRFTLVLYKLFGSRYYTMATTAL